MGPVGWVVHASGCGIEARRLHHWVLALVALVALGGCDGGAHDASGGVSQPSLEATHGGLLPVPGSTFRCTPYKVWDGDGPIHCAEGPKVRLSGIAARERDGSCSPGHPCPEATAEAARDALVGLLGQSVGTAREGHVLVEGPQLTCTSQGSAGGKRSAAWCVSPVHGDLSCAMVQTGTVAKWDRYWRGHRCGGVGA